MYALPGKTPMQKLKQNMLFGHRPGFLKIILMQQVDPILHACWITASLLTLQLSISLIASHFSDITCRPISAWSDDKVKAHLPVNL
jgi:hypothetical protein